MTSFSDKLDEMWEEFGLENWTSKAEANAYILDLIEREVIGEDDEQDHYRDALGRLFCRTCNTEWFAGICACSDLNQLRAEMRAKLNKERK